MPLDIERMDEYEIARFMRSAELRQEELLQEKLDAVRRDILAIVEAEGLTIEQIFAPATKTRAKPPAKYRNPADHSQTWTGRGKTPLWYQAAVDAGVLEHDLLIS